MSHISEDILREIDDRHDMRQSGKETRYIALGDIMNQIP